MFTTDPLRASAACRGVAAVVYDQDEQGWLALRHADVSVMLRDGSFKKDPARAIPVRTQRRC